MTKILESLMVAKSPHRNAASIATVLSIPIVPPEVLVIGTVWAETLVSISILLIWPTVPVQAPPLQLKQLMEPALRPNSGASHLFVTLMPPVVPT